MAGGIVQPGGGTRRRRRSSGGSRPMSEINVTPFVDVMLVLLIIFMVAAPLLTAGVPIELPETAAAPLPQEQEEPLALTIAADGRVLIGSTEVPRDDLVPRLRAIAGERQGDKVFLRADGTVSYSDVMVVMGALNAGGFRNIGLVTEPGGPTLSGAGDGAADTGQ
ncbi:Biopolymer transport protein ExbD [Jannaschia seosinensis]|uniref:Biopolymer transport protein ExbD n=1 Tax=Jannaschia seosinensis TaxID=313367 RepID=A0A0M7BEP9_9RHOB|nr:ExbD/TolR family protein [Jannaschia seosinensis]CUH39786.1 Biopolymer transport protein ExbD [Jannaschia seosinensis]